MRKKQEGDGERQEVGGKGKKSNWREKLGFLKKEK